MVSIRKPLKTNLTFNAESDIDITAQVYAKQQALIQKRLDQGWSIVKTAYYYKVSRSYVLSRSNPLYKPVGINAKSLFLEDVKDNLVNCSYQIVSINRSKYSLWRESDLVAQKNNIFYAMIAQVTTRTQELDRAVGAMTSQQFLHYKSPTGCKIRYGIVFPKHIQNQKLIEDSYIDFLKKEKNILIFFMETEATTKNCLEGFITNE